MRLHGLGGQQHQAVKRSLWKVRWLKNPQMMMAEEANGLRHNAWRTRQVEPHGQARGIPRLRSGQW